MTVGLSESELENIIAFNAKSIITRAGSRATIDTLAEAFSKSLGDTAKAIVKNNEKIEAQLRAKNIYL